jgi:hypothetical protein
VYTYVEIFTVKLPVQLLYINKNIKKENYCQHQWLVPVILATYVTEIRRIMIQGQPGQIVLQELISKKPFTKKGLVGWLKV